MVMWNELWLLSLLPKHQNLKTTHLFANLSQKWVKLNTSRFSELTPITIWSTIVSTIFRSFQCLWKMQSFTFPLSSQCELSKCCINASRQFSNKQQTLKCCHRATSRSEEIKEKVEGEEKKRSYGWIPLRHPYPSPSPVRKWRIC